MKQLILVLLLVFSLKGMSQKPDSISRFSYDYYLKKSKSQKTTAWVFLAGGSTLLISGAIVVSTEFWNDLGNLFEPDPPQKHSSAGEVLVITGLAGIVTSVPFFIAAAKNKKNGHMLQTSLKMRSISYQGLVRVSNKYYPSLTLTIRL